MPKSKKLSEKTTKTESPEERAKSKLLKLLPAFEEANQTFKSLGLDDPSTASMLLKVEKEQGVDFEGLYENLKKRRVKGSYDYDNQLTLADVLYYLVQQRTTKPVQSK